MVVLAAVVAWAAADRRVTLLSHPDSANNEAPHLRGFFIKDHQQPGIDVLLIHHTNWSSVTFSNGVFQLINISLDIT